jgi:hypothetical protein
MLARCKGQAIKRALLGAFHDLSRQPPLAATTGTAGRALLNPCRSAPMSVALRCYERPQRADPFPRRGWKSDQAHENVAPLLS